MNIIPAVDISEGKAVRLVKGDFAAMTVYDEDPVAAALHWKEQGARALHVVDLDGAKAGKPCAIESLRAICKAIEIPVQYGGGLRSLQSIEAAIEAGATRVVLGTAALTDIDLFDSALAKYPERVLVALDVRGGKLATAGWLETSEIDAVSAIRRLTDRGAHSFVYTDIDRDGTLEGISVDEFQQAAGSVRGRFVYSGGVGSLDDIRKLADLRLVNLAGVIVGKALYERRFTLADAQALLKQ